MKVASFSFIPSFVTAASLPSSFSKRVLLVAAVATLALTTFAAIGILTVPTALLVGSVLVGSDLVTEIYLRKFKDVLLTRPQLTLPPFYESTAGFSLISDKKFLEHLHKPAESIAALNFIPKDLEPGSSLEDLFSEFREKYQLMSEKEKEDLHLKYEGRFIYGGRPGDRDIFSDHWFESAVELTEELFKSISENQAVFAVGQSPAWLLEYAKIRKNQPQHWHHVAFGGNCWYIPDPQNNTQAVTLLQNSYMLSRCEGSDRPIKEGEKIAARTRLIKRTDSTPSPEQVASYRSYLKKIGCDPEQICSRPDKTVLIDYVQSGCGIKTYLEFLDQWAQELGCQEKLHEKLQLKLLVFEVEGRNFGSHENHLNFLRLNLGTYIKPQSLHFTVINRDGGIYAMTSIAEKSEDRRLMIRLTQKQWANAAQKGFVDYESKNIENIGLIYAQLLRHKEDPPPSQGLICVKTVQF